MTRVLCLRASKALTPALVGSALVFKRALKNSSHFNHREFPAAAAAAAAAAEAAM